MKELIQHGINPDGFGWGQYSGLTVWYDSATDKINSMRLSDGTKVEDDEYYTLTSIDFLMTGGDSYNFDGHIDPVIIGEMRDVVINQWKSGINKLNYNLLIDGEDTAIIPEAMLSVIDISIVTLIDGNGSYESPLEMKINDVEINKVKFLLNSLKQLGNLEVVVEETDDYTVFKIKMSLQYKSLQDIYITFNVDNKLTEVISAVKELKEDNSVESNQEETPETNLNESGSVGNNENVENGNNEESNSTEGNNKLPQTGAPISSIQVIFIALVITAIGIVLLKKKENII